MVTKKRTAKKTAAKAAANTTAKTERPARAQSRAKDRPKRKRAIGSHRDMLSVEHMDPEFTYRWMLGATENDKRIVFALRDGWELVDASTEQGLVVGDYAVGKSDKLGSVYRIPAARRGREEYLYLMRMSRDDADEIETYKQEEIDATEKALTETRRADDNENGQYGGAKVGEEFRRRVST